MTLDEILPLAFLDHTFITLLWYRWSYSVVSGQIIAMSLHAKSPYKVKAIDMELLDLLKVG